MNICTGKINGVKCKYFDEEFKQCDNSNRSHKIAKDLKSCKYYKQSNGVKVNETLEIVPSITDDLIKSINEDSAQVETFQNFLSLKQDEQKFVFYVMVHNLDPQDAVKKVFEIEDDKEEIKTRNKKYYLLNKPQVVKAMKEFANTVFQDVLEIQGLKIAKKLTEASDVAVGNMIQDYIDKKTDADGNPIVRHSDILMANKIHADTQAKYKKQLDLSSSGGVITFGNGQQLMDIIGELKELPAKEVGE
jgi:hypothetical protein